MSHDLIVFDAGDLTGFPSDVNAINSWINAFVSDDPHEVRQGTIKVQRIVATMGQKFGAMSNDGGIWTCWPPICLAGGRYCTFNLDRSSDITNMTIELANAAKMHELVLLDPQGKNPVLTTPNGGGVMDF